MFEQQFLALGDKRPFGGGTHHSKFAESAEMREFAEKTLADDAAATAGRTAIGEVAGAVIVTLGLGVGKASQ